jgi:glycosyltransferase involved in cell wall biosynthesis
MRIAIVGSTQEIIGGAEVYIRWVLADFVARGHEVAYAYEFPTKRPDRAVDHGISGIQRWCIAETGEARFFDELRAFAPDLVYLQSTEDVELEVEISRRFRCILFAHAFYGTCATGLRAHRWPVEEICQRRFAPSCLVINYARGCGTRRPRDLIRGYRSQSQRLRTLAAVKAVLVASAHVRDVFERQGIDSGKLHVVPYPVTGVARLPEAPRARPFTNRVVFLGRLTRLKGLTDAVTAVAQASRALGRNLTLDVAGEGPELEAARRLASVTNADARFLGWVGADQRERLLSEADALIVPSRWPEPFGMVGIEAGCTGVPAVAYAVGGIPDWLRPGVSGESAPEGSLDPSALASALARALRSSEHHQALREGAWRTSAEYSSAVHRSHLSHVIARVAPDALLDRA